jgi:hypothetical protein
MMSNTYSENYVYFITELGGCAILMKFKRANLTFTDQQTILHRITMPSSGFGVFQASYYSYNGKAPAESITTIILIEIFHLSPQMDA